LGARAAEPGEFTRRAFLNDKLDLAQAESVADLIEASSEAAARAAMRSLQGEFSQQIELLVRRLVDLRALVEALLDFPEEEIELPQRQGIEERLNALVSGLGSIQRAARSGALLREGSIVVLIGRPNVGKSSLLNRLAGEELAIVTEIPGTTRDTIRQELLIEGVPIHVVDTAGLRESVDRIEQLGMARTRDIIQKADVAVVVVDTRDGLVEDDEAVLKEVPAKVPRVIVFNKIDLSGETPQVSNTERGSELRVSARTGAGIEMLRHQILAAVGWQPLEEGVFLARERHLSALQLAAEHLNRASEVLESIELIAEELRLAQERLVELTGGFTADDLLGEIFSRFCIGK
jgi:tRNA modification GTPase